MTDLRTLQAKVAQLWPHLAERARRLFVASEARQVGLPPMATAPAVPLVPMFVAALPDALISEVPSTNTQAGRARQLRNLTRPT